MQGVGIRRDVDPRPEVPAPPHRLVDSWWHGVNARRLARDLLGVELDVDARGADARSHVWISTSGVHVISTAASNESRPGGPQSSTRSATAGLSRPSWIASRTAAHAPPGSSSTEGIGRVSRPKAPSRKPGPGSQSTR